LMLSFPALVRAVRIDLEKDSDQQA